MHDSPELRATFAAIELQRSFSTFLTSRKWHAMFTATFAVQQKYPHTAIEMVSHRLPFYRKAFIAAELHKLGGYHCHGLVEFSHLVSGDMDALCTNTVTSLKRGGFCTVAPIRDTNAVSAYCTKYITKEMGDYEFFGSSMAWRY